MNCQHKELLIAYCTGRLESETAADVERHLETCAACVRLRDEQQAAWRALDVFEAPHISAGFDLRLYRRIETDGPPAWRRWFLAPALWRPAVPLAATAALILAGVVLQRPDAKPPAEPQAVIEVEQVERTLEDLEMLQQFNLVARKEAEPQRSM
jgi:anti-sigma factor RsiW